jgi:transcription initiation factor TFIIIB Brf1 subunit/transcription initiation factor TFIIB
MARPKLKIDEGLIENLAKIHCTTVEIAAVIGVDEGTIRKRYSDKIAKWREGGKTTLRRLQWHAATKGNTAMLIWLGKQILGQTDKMENKLSGGIDTHDSRLDKLSQETLDKMEILIKGEIDNGQA